MGFYYGSTQLKRSSDEIRPIVTPREYTALLAEALGTVIRGRPQESDTYRRGVAAAAAASGLLEGLSRQVCLHPDDPTEHRSLAIAHLYAGNRKPAFRHLEVAVNILLGQAATRGSLYRALSARVGLALMLPMVLPLCRRLGKRQTARRLLGAALSIW